MSAAICPECGLPKIGRCSCRGRTPEERAERLRKRFLFPEARESFIAIVAEDIRSAVQEEQRRIFAALKPSDAVAAEREACAKIAAAYHTIPLGSWDALLRGKRGCNCQPEVHDAAEGIAAAIRARGRATPSAPDHATTPELGASAC